MLLALSIGAASLLAACGLAETTAVTGANANAAAQEAAAGKQTEERVKQQIDAAQELEKQRRADAEREATQ
jgi:hypothetical protein